MRINDCYVFAATLPGCQPGSVYGAAHAGSKMDAYNAVFFRNIVEYTQKIPSGRLARRNGRLFSFGEFNDLLNGNLVFIYIVTIDTKAVVSVTT